MRCGAPGAFGARSWPGEGSGGAGAAALGGEVGSRDRGGGRGLTGWSGGWDRGVRAPRRRGLRGLPSTPPPPPEPRPDRRGLGSRSVPASVLHGGDGPTAERPQPCVLTGDDAGGGTGSGPGLPPPQGLEAGSGPGAVLCFTPRPSLCLVDFTYSCFN